MNVNEYGVVFQFGTSFDMSGSTALSLAFTKPDGTVLTKTNPAVTVGSVQITTPLGTFAVHQYVLYTFAAGDVTLAGTWKVRLTYTDATPQQLISDIGSFTINP